MKWLQTKLSKALDLPLSCEISCLKTKNKCQKKQVSILNLSIPVKLLPEQKYNRVFDIVTNWKIWKNWRLHTCTICYTTLLLKGIVEKQRLSLEKHTKKIKINIHQYIRTDGRHMHVSDFIIQVNIFYVIGGQ